MNTILAKAKEHFNSQLSGELKSLEVPEWGSTIYYKPMNIVQRDKIMKHALNNELGAAAVEAVILRSLKEDGSRVFKDADKVDLTRQVDPKVVDRIFAEMGGVDDDLLPTVEETKES